MLTFVKHFGTFILRSTCQYRSSIKLLHFETIKFWRPHVKEDKGF